MDLNQALEYIHLTDYIEAVVSPEHSIVPVENEAGFRIACLLQVNHERVGIITLIPKDFPQSRPKFLLPKYDTLGFIPHITPIGVICYLETESNYTNTEVPLTVFQAAVELAIETLGKGISGTNHSDFREEFQVYWEWNQHLSPMKVSSVIEVGDEAKKVQLVKNKQEALVIDEDIDKDRAKRLIFNNPKAQDKAGLYIPVELDDTLMPPRFDEKWSAAQAVDWLKPRISEANWIELRDSLLAKRPARFEFLILGIKRETGTTVLVGIQLKPKKDPAHPLLATDSDWGARFLKITRLDRPALLPRGGSDIELNAKRVLLVGCGSVGSHFAVLMAKAGIGHLTLVDDDELKSENVQRFAIGFSYSGRMKVYALRDFIDSNYYHTKVHADALNFENWLKKEGNRLEDFDLIVSATGDPAINWRLNQLLRKAGGNRALLVGWNEPLGLGGHSIVGVAEQAGCYRCLFRNDGHNRASFAAPAAEQPKPFHRKHLGCGEVYTPYSALDSTRTSEVMVRLAAQYLKGELTMSTIRSWKGNSESFTKEGFALAPRYTEQTHEEMEARATLFTNPNCPHCAEAA